MKIKQLIILSFCLCGLAACEDIYKGGENHQQTEVAVLFKPSITSYDKDEVEKWKEGETVGVYMIRNKADFSLENSINQIFNKNASSGGWHVKGLRRRACFCIRQMRQRWILFSMHHGIQVWKRMYYNLTSESSKIRFLRLSLQQ